MHLRASPWIPLVVPILSWSCLPAAVCNSDGDCVDGRRCVSGTCAAPPVTDEGDGGRTGVTSSGPHASSHRASSTASGAAGTSAARSSSASPSGTSVAVGSSSAPAAPSSSLPAASSADPGTSASPASSGGGAGSSRNAPPSSASSSAPCGALAQPCCGGTCTDPINTTCSADRCVTYGPYAYSAWATQACDAAGCAQTRTESCAFDVCHTPQVTAQTVTSYVMTATCTAWDACNASCGGGTQACNAQNPTSWDDTAPAYSVPDRSCNTQACYGPPFGCWATWRCGEYCGNTDHSCPGASPYYSGDMDGCCASAGQANRAACSWNAGGSCPHPGNCAGDCNRRDACGNLCECNGC